MTFDELWKLHLKWGKGMFSKEIIETRPATIYISHLPGKYWNFAVPTKSEISESDLQDLNKLFAKYKTPLTYYIPEKYQNISTVDFLKDHGLTIHYTDSWLYLETTQPVKEVNYQIVQVNKNNSLEYFNLELEVFGDDYENRVYQQMTVDSMSNNFNPKVPDLRSELYMIYEENKPAAAAAIFFSENLNIAYLHSGATKEKFRGKGYQSSLIKHRINRGIENNISRFYSLAEFESGSSRNLKKLDFEQIQKVPAYVLNLI